MVLLTLHFGGNKILGLTGTSAEKDKLRTTIIFNAFVFCQVSFPRFKKFFTLLSYHCIHALNHSDEGRPDDLSRSRTLEFC